MLFFLLHKLYRSIYHQVSNQADKLALLAIISFIHKKHFSNCNFRFSEEIYHKRSIDAVSFSFFNGLKSMFCLQRLLK